MSAADNVGRGIGGIIPGVGPFLTGISILRGLSNISQRRYIDDPGPLPGTSMQGGGPGSISRVAAGPRPTLPATIPAPPTSPPIIYRPPPEPPTYGSGSSGIPPRSQPPSGAGASPDAPGRTPTTTVTMDWRQFAIMYGFPYAVEAGRAAYDWYKTGQRTVPRTPGGRRRFRNRPTVRPGREDPYRNETFSNREMGNPFPAKGPAERIPRGERVATVMGTLGGDIYVRTQRLPVPEVVPTPVPPAPPAPAPKVPLWMQLLPIIGPSLLSLLVPGTTNRNILSLTDPLTQPQPDTGGGDPFPLTEPQTAVASFLDFGGGGSGAVGTNTCECKPKRKKGRKKKRTVCYSGTFIEGANGIRKYKKRKVQCL